MASFAFKPVSVRWLATASAFVLVLLPVVAQAQSADTDSRLSRIERDIETISRTVYKGQKPTGPIPGSVDVNAAAMQQQMDERLNRLEQDLRDLTGQMESQGNVLNQIKAQMDRTVADLQSRVAVIEQKMGIGAVANTMPSTTGAQPLSGGASAVIDRAADVVSAAQPPQPAAAPNDPAPANSPTVSPLGNITNSAEGAAVIPSSDPTQMYENAITLLKQRDYVVAEKTLQDFLKANPNHTLTPNAKYWLGEAYFAQNKYEQAARVFAEGYQQFPKGPKAADNLLKLGLSLSAMNNKTDACVALQQIGKDFPNGATAVNTRAKTEIKRLKCGG